MCDELENAIRSYYINLGIECLNCGNEVNANECEIQENGQIICPNCKEDICG